MAPRVEHVGGYSYVRRGKVIHVRPYSRTTDLNIGEVVSVRDTKTGQVGRQVKVVGLNPDGTVEVVEAYGRAKGQGKPFKADPSSLARTQQVTLTPEQTTKLNRAQFELAELKRKAMGAVGPTRAQSIQRQIDAKNDELRKLRGETPSTIAAPKPGESKELVHGVPADVVVEEGARLDRARGIAQDLLTQDAATYGSIDQQKSKARLDREAKGWSPGLLGVNQFGHSSVEARHLPLLTDAELDVHISKIRSTRQGVVTAYDGKTRIDTEKSRKVALQAAMKQKAKRDKQASTSDSYVVREMGTGKVLSSHKTKKDAQVAAMLNAGTVEKRDTPKPPKYRIVDRQATQSSDLTSFGSMRTGGRFLIVDENNKTVDEANSRYEARQAVQMLKLQAAPAAEPPQAKSKIDQLKAERDRVAKAAGAADRRQAEAWDKSPGVQDRIDKTVAKHKAKLQALDRKIAAEAQASPSVDSTVVKQSGRFALEKYPDGRFGVRDTKTGELMPDLNSTGAAGGKLRNEVRAEERLAAWHSQELLPGGMGDEKQPVAAADTPPPGFTIKPFINNQAGTYSTGYRTEQQGFVVEGPDKNGGTIVATREEALANARKRADRYAVTQKTQAEIAARQERNQQTSKLTVSPKVKNEMRHQLEINDPSDPSAALENSAIEKVLAGKPLTSPELRALDRWAYYHPSEDEYWGPDKSTRKRVVSGLEKLRKDISALSKPDRSAPSDVPDSSGKATQAVDLSHFDTPSAGRTGTTEAPRGRRPSALTDGSVIQPQNAPRDVAPPAPSKSASPEVRSALAGSGPVLSADFLKRAAEAGSREGAADKELKKLRAARAARAQGSGVSGGATKSYSELSLKALRRRSKAGDSHAADELKRRQGK